MSLQLNGVKSALLYAGVMYATLKVIAGLGENPIHIHLIKNMRSLNYRGDILRKRDGIIKQYDEIPKEELGEWSKPFHVGMKVDFQGVNMEIIKIKQVRKQILLQFAGQ